MSSSCPPAVGPPGETALTTASGDWRRGLGAIGSGTWLRAGAFGLVAALVIAVPTRLLPNGFFSRMTPTRPLDYVFLAFSSALLGLTLALRAARADAGSPSTATASPDSGGTGTRAAAAGIGTVLAVGCPVCNKLVVALLGTGGAMSIFAPLQPLIGLGAAGLLAFGLRRQLLALGAAACSRPAVPQGSGPSALAGRLPGTD